RGESGAITAVTPARGSPHRESLMHFEVDRLMTDAESARLEEGLRRVLGELGLAVRDFLPMVERVERMIEAATGAGGRYSRDEIHESVEFLQWRTDDNFVYLGYREYEIVGDADAAVLRVVPDSGLGILSDPRGSAYSEGVRMDDLRPSLRRRVEDGPLVLISKTNRETSIHRLAKMDYIGVKRVEGGRIVGELRLIGLFTSKTYAESARAIPLLRRKLDAIMRWEDLFAGSHDYKAVVSIFDGLPKDELFAATAQELRVVVMALLAMQGAGDVRLLARLDRGGRSVSVLVALPPDHVSTELLIRLEHLLEERFRGTSVDHHLSVDTDPAWFHFTVHVPEGEIPDVDLGALEREVIEAARTWDDLLSDALVDELGAVAGHRLARRYAALFPGYYKSSQAVYQALFDVTQFERLGPDRPYVIALQNERNVAEPATRLKLYKTGGKAPLTDLLPLFEQLGLTVIEEVPTRLQGDEGQGRYLHDFGVVGPDGAPLDLDRLGTLVADTVSAVWDGRAGSDWLNRLVVAGELDWRAVSILRAYREYRQLLGAQFTSRYQNDCLVRNSAISRKLLELFDRRFNPSREHDLHAVAGLEESILADLDKVASLDDDRILRGYLGLILATVRTNAYVRGGQSEHISFKFRCSDVPGMPKPVPMWEIFVFSPAMAGVHLRGGYVARGGIRWSDRLEDYRTEILGLMKAQMVKNAVIVPVGAKGGFILKRPPVDKAELREEERRQYITLIRGMLDLTDNMVGGEIVHPADVRVLDEIGDAYMVVAADKGTAHLSDTANEVSAEYGFWMGDAFASGGSAGYDHKALGITARGGWESVKRHFREMGRDIMSQPFTVVGIGDMSGDVFGNAMLLSPHLRLVAAFDHRHIFLDPDPDAEGGLAERQRLFALAGSSWDDYDRSLISEGGGVWPRSAKSVPLSPAARIALGVRQEAMTPNELMRAVL
ncbi:MAG: NAD-glutamate dehydrogenase domain-containing protein, partial [Gaiellales bacterium]